MKKNEFQKILQEEIDFVMNCVAPNATEKWDKSEPVEVPWEKAYPGGDENPSVITDPEKIQKIITIAKMSAMKPPVSAIFEGKNVILNRISKGDLGKYKMYSTTPEGNVRKLDFVKRVNSGESLYEALPSAATLPLTPDLVGKTVSLAYGPPSSSYKVLGIGKIQDLLKKFTIQNSVENASGITQGAVIQDISNNKQYFIPGQSFSKMYKLRKESITESEVEWQKMPTEWDTTFPDTLTMDYAGGYMLVEPIDKEGKTWKVTDVFTDSRKENGRGGETLNVGKNLQQSKQTAEKWAKKYEDENVEPKPYEEPGAWEGGFADNHLNEAECSSCHGEGCAHCRGGRVPNDSIWANPSTIKKDEFQNLMASMDIPELRKTDYAWLNRNLHIRNHDNPNFPRAMQIIRDKLKKSKYEIPESSYFSVPTRSTPDQMSGRDNQNFEQVEQQPSPIDGKDKRAAVKWLYKNIVPKTAGFFKDNSWEGIYKNFYDELEKAGVNYTIEGSEYQKNEEGVPSSKSWKFEINFTTNKGKPAIIYGRITAHGAGSVSDPLNKYDITVSMG